MTLTYDGHWVYVDLKEDTATEWIDLAADLAIYCQDHGITLIPRGAEVRDNPNGSLTVRYGIRSFT
jgi:hypothetical protein